jgi:hypothetical protein
MTATWVLACALTVLGRSATSLPPIELLEVPPIEASPAAEAFVRPPERTIYLITSSPAFREAMRVERPCGHRREIVKIASILLHEEWHVLHGSDESGAYRVQLQSLIRFGVPHNSPLYISVVRSMLAALKKTQPKPAIVIAGAPPPPVPQDGVSSGLQ